MGFAESGDAALPDSCFFIASRFGVTGGYVWGFAPSPSKELRSLHPFFASRRVEEGLREMTVRGVSCGGFK